MKKNIIGSLVVASMFLAGSCKQELPELTPPTTETPETPSAGTVDFTKYVAVGTSYTAGFQAGALFTAGQDNSLAAILNKQFATVGAPSEFKQPDIKTDLGFNIFVTPNPVPPNNTVLGRFLLQYNGAASPTPTPQVSTLAAVPNPGINPSFIFGNGDEKATLNNFAIPAITLGQSLITQTGDWSGAGADPRFSPFYGRLAYPGTGSTLIGDVAASGGTFFSFWMGMDDYMLYAAFGGDTKKAPLTPWDAGMPYGFDWQFPTALGSILLANPNAKVVVGNLPDIFSMPHFTSVSYNPIPLDAETAAAVSTGFAGYNQALTGIAANAGAFGLTAAQVAEINTRKVNFSEASNNAILIYDTDLFDLGPYFDGLQASSQINATQRAQLAPYQRVRQTTPADIIPLAAGGILGTVVGGNPQLVNGVSVPLADQYVIVPSERDSIISARHAYNAIIASTVATFSDQAALADVDEHMETLLVARAGVYNNVTITPNINPPTGIYSEDGLHPNTRGYAYVSLAFIKSINAKFDAKIPLTDLSLYGATALPIP